MWAQVFEKGNNNRSPGMTSTVVCDNSKLATWFGFATLEKDLPGSAAQSLKFEDQFHTMSKWRKVPCGVGMLTTLRMARLRQSHRHLQT